MISPARDAAFRVLFKVEGGGYASDLLRRETLETRDAGLAETIVFGCLRYQAQLDWLIAQLAKRPKLDAEVRLALRMGVFQLRYLDRIPPHAAVSESVELVKRAKKESAAGFVNGVLRSVLRKGPRAPITWPDLATELSVPQWMLDRWQRQYGADAAAKIARDALEEPATPLNPETGRLQDLGAQSVVPLLELETGMTLLDLCAAPGNKAAQALAAGARVIACDRYEKRLVEVPTDAERVVLDASQPLPFGPKFDRILVDAPCSGTGTLARNPEIKWRLRPTDLARFEELQRRILKNALASLAPGGRLVYATCSLESEENEKIIEGMRVLRTETRLPGRDLGDGFFAAVITLL
ncbi:MAG TPA: transcription antitermination factor NusB [Bryobacteraceae bacterium]|nr:transcription antitermination factor NusB [Bryobacteraceae bacterium]